MTNLLIILIFLMLLLTISYPQWQKRATYKRWYNSLRLSNHLNIFQQLYSDVDGFHLSRLSRVSHNAIEYTYGEIDFIAFIALISLTRPNCNTVFYDLGSGTGKAVMACCMVFNIKRSYGIEYFSLLHQAALNQRDKLKQLPDYSEKANTIHFIHGDFLESNVADATLIFVHATAFFGDTWIALMQHLMQIKPGTLVITTSKRLAKEAFLLIRETNVQMSWGIVRAYIQQRKASSKSST